MARFAAPLVQVAIIGFVCFLCPGMLNALSGIGGGGQVDASASNNGAIALYSTFAATSFFSGSINNVIGARLALSLGASGYALYMASFLSYNLNTSGSFIVAAGALLGVCAGLLWTAQGALVLAYATEDRKGRYTALFWAIFNTGAVLGSAIELGLTKDSTSNTVSNSTYIAFLVLSSLGTLLPWTLVRPERMLRADGAKVVVPQNPSWRSELMGLYICLRKDFYIVLLFPFFLVSNWFYTWQFNDYNGALFTLRTRALNNFLYWLMQIAGAFAFGTAIDSTRFRRRTRAWGGLAAVALLSMPVWAGCYSVQTGYTRADIGVIPRIDWTTQGYGGYIVLYIFCGITDAVWQNYAYWIMGAMSNDAAQLAYFVGFYKAIQSAGAAGVYKMDFELVPYKTMVIVSWCLAALGIICAVPLIALRVNDHTDVFDEDVVKSASIDGEKETQGDAWSEKQ